MHLRGIALTFCLLCLQAAPAWPDGDDFFVPMLNPDGSELIEGGYAGSVKDPQGRPLRDATVKVVVTLETPEGPIPFALNAYTDQLGRYRSRDPNAIFADYLTETNAPRRTELQVLKDGYEVVRRFDRGRLRPLGPVEIDFVMRARPHQGPQK